MSRGAPRSGKRQPFQALGGGAKKQLWMKRWKASMNVCTFGKALNCQSPPGPQELAGSGGTQVALWLSGPGLLAELRFHQPPASCGQVWPPAPRASPRVGDPGPGGDERQEHAQAAPPHSRRAPCRCGAHVRRGCPHLWGAQPTLLGLLGSTPQPHTKVSQEQCPEVVGLCPRRPTCAPRTLAAGPWRE